MRSRSVVPHFYPLGVTKVFSDFKRCFSEVLTAFRTGVCFRVHPNILSDVRSSANKCSGVSDMLSGAEIIFLNMISGAPEHSFGCQK